MTRRTVALAPALHALLDHSSEPDVVRAGDEELRALLAVARAARRVVGSAQFEASMASLDRALARLDAAAKGGRT